MLLSDYIDVGNYFEDNGVFDPVLDNDNGFFINMLRLKTAKTPEFQASYQRINDLFRKIIKLLDRAEKKDVSDIFFRQALTLFDFSEVNGIGLGFSEKAPGSGFGPLLSKKVIETAYDIVKAGITDPEFFQLLPLFQNDVGPDRLSDMIATIILPDIEAYTKRIYVECEINAVKYPDKEFVGTYMLNPYRGHEILLLPIEIIHKLPIAKSWEEIDSVVTENNIIRSVMNQQVAEEWSKYSSSLKKQYLREKVFTDSKTCQYVVDEYKKEELDLYNPEDRIEYLLEKIWQRILRLDMSWKTKLQEEIIDSKSAALEIMAYFKQWVENNKGWEVIQDASSRNREKILQRIIHLSGLCYIEKNNFDMSCEPDEGRGPVDFKVSRGQEKTLIEVKLSSNSQYLHGYEVQVEEYGKAENTDKLVYVLVDVGNPLKVKRLKELHKENIGQGKKVPELIIIDSMPKVSASRT